jgi:hypothetical protein
METIHEAIMDYLYALDSLPTDGTRQELVDLVDDCIAKVRKVL